MRRGRGHLYIVDVLLYVELVLEDMAPYIEPGFTVLQLQWKFWTSRVLPLCNRQLEIFWKKQKFSGKFLCCSCMHLCSQLIALLMIMTVIFIMKMSWGCWDCVLLHSAFVLWWSTSKEVLSRITWRVRWQLSAGYRSTRWYVLSLTSLSAVAHLYSHAFVHGLCSCWMLLTGWCTFTLGVLLLFTEIWSAAIYWLERTGGWKSVILV